MRNTYCFTNEATVLTIEPAENGAGWCVILDATCFHPQGGGQPADEGTLRCGDGEPFRVTMVRKDKAGVIRHEGESRPAFECGVTVRCIVNEAFRRQNARVHSAGHLIDVAMGASGCQLRPGKGYHFTPGAYVEYEGKLDAAAREALLPKVQGALDELVSAAVATCVATVEGVRVVTIGGQGCPCGGTHVNDTSEIGSVKIEAIKSKGKATRVSYSLVEA